jgi:uncharacterized protein (TIGR03083 family)
MTPIEANIAAWRHTFDATVGLGEAMTADEWDAPTECPEWTVMDVYSHLIGGELWMAAGHPVPATGLDTIAAEPVLARRATPPAYVVAELRDVFARRVVQLAAHPPDPDEPTQTAFGLPVSLGTLYGHRAFDGWVHEQDIRRAIDQPGNLASPAALISRDILLASLPWVVAKRAGAPAGAVVGITVTGPVEFDRAVVVDENRRAKLVDGTAGPTTAQLRTDWETYLRLATGRAAPDQVADRVDITGDQDLANRILARFSVTP